MIMAHVDEAAQVIARNEQIDAAVIAFLVGIGEIQRGMILAAANRDAILERYISGTMQVPAGHAANVYEPDPLFSEAEKIIIINRVKERLVVPVEEAGGGAYARPEPRSPLSRTSEMLW